MPHPRTSGPLCALVKKLPKNLWGRLVTCGRLAIGPSQEATSLRAVPPWGSQSWLQRPFSGTTRPGHDVLNQRQPQKTDLLKIKGLLELSLERRLVVLALLTLSPALAQTPHHTNYEEDVRPIFARHCFGCHNASEVRAGLNLESYNGVMKGGGSGDIVIAGRPASSMLYKAVAREEGAPQMPLGQAKIPDAEIAVIRDWIQQGLLETAVSAPKGPTGPSPLDFAPSSLNKPAGI